jgi:hypothetical protein
MRENTVYDFLKHRCLVFTIMDKPASFLGEFDEYPIPTLDRSAGYGISAQVFAAQYASFEGDYISGGNTTVISMECTTRTTVQARYRRQVVVFRVILEDDTTLTSVDSLEFDELFNGVFTLTVPEPSLFSPTPIQGEPLRSGMHSARTKAKRILF